MAKFKKGDRVRCISSVVFMDAGEVGTVDEDNSSMPWVIIDGYTGRHPVPENALDLIGGTMKAGDILTDGYVTCKVLAYINQGIELVLLSINEDYETVDRWYLVDDVSKDWKVKTAEEDVKEMTLEEVAKLANVPVEKLRIKE